MALEIISQEHLSVALSAIALVVSCHTAWYSRRLGTLSHDREIRDAWMDIDDTALSNDQLLIIADEILDPHPKGESLKSIRRRWLGYKIMNVVLSHYESANFHHKSSREYKKRISSCEEILRNILEHDDIYEILDGHGYDQDFVSYCKGIREKLGKESVIQN